MANHSLQQGILLTAVLLLAACTSTLSKNISPEGTVASEQDLVFPDKKKAALSITPNAENLRKIAPGVTKDDLYYLIGRPHFSEMLGAREWDYLFNVAEAPEGVCQYKVLFDKQKRGQRFYWQPADCAQYFGEQVASFNSDALFDFDSTSISQEGKHALKKVVTTLKEKDNEHAKIRLLGFADRLGTASYNARLSLARAEIVKRYLVQQGIASSRIVTEGKGTLNARVTCKQTDRRALIKCLAPNRRVEIYITPH